MGANSRYVKALNAGCMADQILRACGAQDDTSVRSG